MELIINIKFYTFRGIKGFRGEVGPHGDVGN